MNGFFIVNREVLVARALERGGRSAPGLDFIKWRYQQLKIDVWDDAEFWGIPHRDIALSRAAEIAEARTGNTVVLACRSSCQRKYAESLEGPVVNFFRVPPG